MKATLWIVCTLVLAAAVLVGAHKFNLISLPAPGSGTHEREQVVPFAVHYPPDCEVELLDERGRDMIGRTLDKHRSLLHRADVYVSEYRTADPYGMGHTAHDTAVRVTLEAARDVTLNSRTDTAGRKRAAQCVCDAIERCVAALVRAHTDPDLKHRLIKVFVDL